MCYFLDFFKSTFLQDHQAAICEMVGHAKIVFGNAREMIALAQALNVKYDDVTDIPFLLNSLKRITVDVSSANSKDWLTDDGIFVMTRGGCAPAIIVWGKGQSVQVRFNRENMKELLINAINFFFLFRYHQSYRKRLSWTRRVPGTL